VQSFRPDEQTGVDFIQDTRKNVDVSDKAPRLFPRLRLEKVAPSGQLTRDRFLQRVVSLKALSA
jgi:hypothetical protein